MITPGDDILASDFAATRYYTISGPDFLPEFNTSVWYNNNSVLFCNDAGSLTAYAIAHLPHGAIVTSIKAYWFRDVAAASGVLQLKRQTVGTGATDTMANADSNSFAGNHSVEDTSISNATIDNTAYNYFMYLLLNPDAASGDVYLRTVVITYTIVVPFP